MTKRPTAKKTAAAQPATTTQKPSNEHIAHRAAAAAVARRTKTPAPAPAPTPATATGIEAMVCQDIAMRQVVGREKYGVTLADAGLTLREALVHCYQEALDCANYLRAAIDTIDRSGIAGKHNPHPSGAGHLRR